MSGKYTCPSCGKSWDEIGKWQSLGHECIRPAPPTADRSQEEEMPGVKIRFTGKDGCGEILYFIGNTPSTPCEYIYYPAQQKPSLSDEEWAKEKATYPNGQLDKKYYISILHGIQYARAETRGEIEKEKTHAYMRGLDAGDHHKDYKIIGMEKELATLKSAHVEKINELQNRLANAYSKIVEADTEATRFQTKYTDACSVIAAMETTRAEANRKITALENDLIKCGEAMEKDRITIADLKAKHAEELLKESKEALNLFEQLGRAHSKTVPLECKVSMLEAQIADLTNYAETNDELTAEKNALAQRLDRITKALEQYVNGWLPREAAKALLESEKKRG